jgi:hypothetical protein
LMIDRDGANDRDGLNPASARRNTHLSSRKPVSGLRASPDGAARRSGWRDAALANLEPPLSRKRARIGWRHAFATDVRTSLTSPSESSNKTSTAEPARLIDPNFGSVVESGRAAPSSPDTIDKLGGNCSSAFAAAGSAA